MQIAGTEMFFTAYGTMGRITRYECKKCGETFVRMKYTDEPEQGYAVTAKTGREDQ